jgi:hypothetical protein
MAQSVKRGKQHLALSGWTTLFRPVDEAQQVNKKDGCSKSHPSFYLTDNCFRLTPTYSHPNNPFRPSTFCFLHTDY